ncbi:SDR family oxidoreductase [Sphingobacterium sp. MYb382]|uniref:SDR family oxidoreductase n=1 Tax=Sphingobacterium sp. MYb382 TaxID=2745278 RepID=UPI0030A7601C
MTSKESQNYKMPPFETQKQVPPGVESIMDPIPDHGEETYVGNNLLKDKIVLITGGDSGIGKAVAIAMAREGAHVVIGYKDSIEDADALNTLAWIEKAGSKGALLPGDIRSEEFCRFMIEETVAEFGRIDILINNAAYQMSYDNLEDISALEWNKTFETNLSAMFYLVKHALAHIPTGGSIINTTSVNAYTPNPSLIPYAASKAAIQNFTASLAKKFLEEGKGIRVNAVAPGPVWTPLIPSTIPDHEGFGSKSPMGRPAQPAELAPVYVFLASPQASYISGATIPVTGGEITI